MALRGGRTGVCKHSPLSVSLLKARVASCQSRIEGYPRALRDLPPRTRAMSLRVGSNP